jgi:hypothetical protein
VRITRRLRVILSVVAVLIGAACSREPAFVRQTQELNLIRDIQQALLESVAAEKSAVIATTDEESRGFASEAERFELEINRLREELRSLIAVDGRPEEIAKLEAFDSAWNELEAVDKRLLALAVANTNLKATRLSVQDGEAALTRFVDLLIEMQGATSDPSMIRALALASASALRIQSLLLAHIPAADDAEMTLLEKRMNDLSAETDRILAEAGKVAKISPAALAQAIREWTEYRRILSDVLRLSRQNTNVISFDVSVHEKRRVTEGCLAALAELAEAVESVPPGTR